VSPSQAVKVNALVSNTGGSEGKYTVILKVDDKEEAKKEITVAPGKNQSVSFSALKYTAGSHSIDVNGLKGQFTVKPLAAATSPTNTQTESNTGNRTVFYIIISGLLLVVAILFIVYKRMS
jgi:hypothetical protein